MIGYSSDNAQVMISANNSVFFKVREQQPNEVNIGCVCHIMSTCTQYAVKKWAMPVERCYKIHSHISNIAQKDNKYSKISANSRTLLLIHLLGIATPAGCPYKRVSTNTYSSATSLKYLQALIFRFLSFILAPLNDFNTTFQVNY
jgi:hypothetical protein